VSTASEAELREIQGPSALGGGWRRFFDLTWLIATNKFKVTYLGTVLGYLWSLIRPLMLFAVLLFVFTKVIRLGGKVDHYAVLLLFGIMLFSFFSEATQGAVVSVVQEEGVVRRTQFPRLAIPLATVLASVFNLAVSLVAVFIFILAFGVGPYWSWLLLPVLLLPLFVFTCAVAAILSALNVRYRDTAVIWSVMAQALFYATPILYTLKDPAFLSEKYRWIIFLNPLTPIFVQARHWIIDPSAPGVVSTAGGVPQLLPAAAIFVAICVASVWIFHREAPRMAEEL
jgi:ABC-2 type transport system permease protein